MVGELYIDKAIYLVDDRNRTYQYLRRNPQWKKLSFPQNETNKKSIEGYARLLRSCGKKIYRGAEHG